MSFLDSKALTLIGNWLEISNSEVQYVKDQVRAMLKVHVQKTSEPHISTEEKLIVAPVRYPQVDSLPCEGYILEIGLPGLSRYKATVSTTGELVKLVKLIPNTCEPIQDILALDESKGFPVVLNEEWEIHSAMGADVAEGAIASREGGEADVYLFNTKLEKRSELQVKFPQHNGADYPLGCYNCEVDLARLFARHKCRFFRLPQYDTKYDTHDVYAVVIARENHGIDLLPCLVSPTRGLMVITDFARLYDYPEPLAGKVSEEGLMYRFHVDEDIEEVLFRSETIRGPVSFFDIPYYRNNNAQWRRVVSKDAFTLKPLIQLGGEFGSSYECDHCQAPIEENQDTQFCTQCDYICCSKCTPVHEHLLVKCHSFQDILDSYTITL